MTLQQDIDGISRKQVYMYIYIYPAGRRLFLKPSLPSDCFIVRTTVFPTQLLQLRPFSSRMFVMSNCDHGLAQLGLPVLVRGVHAYTS